MKLFTVGPVEMEREIITANDGGIPYFRNQEFSEKMFKIQERLLELLNAPKGYRTVILTCSGTGGMESAICSIPKGKKVLIINGGTFGARFKEIAEIHNIKYDEVKVDEDKNLTRADLEKYLNNNVEYFALICNVDETSIGKLYDTKLLREFADKKKCYLILDAISSAFADDYDLSKIKADITILSSQKALSLAPGISILVLSQRYIDEVINKSEERVSYYLDLKDHLKNMERGQTPFTPALAEIEQLRVKLFRIKSYEDEVRSVAELAKYFREQLKLKTKSFKLPEYNLSNCVTPIICLNNNAGEIIEKLKAKGLIVNPCGGENKDRMMRVGHIGNITKRDMANLIKALMEKE